MITAVQVDLMMSLVAVVMGIYVMVARMRVIDKNAGTPMLEVAIVCSGALSWVIFGFLALSALIAYPDWHHKGYVGHWGYTSARAMGFVMWVLSMHLVSKYCAYMIERKEQNKE